MKRTRRPTGHDDLFATGDMFPVRRPVERERPVDVLRIKTALGEALRNHPESAEIIAAKIAALTGRNFTTFALYSYTAPSRDDHDIGLSRFVAFVRVTGAYWLWDLLVEDDGLTVLQGREAKLAQLGHLEQQQQRISSELRELRRELGDEPVTPQPRRGNRR
jgi:hypothetical protein